MRLLARNVDVHAAHCQRRDDKMATDNDDSTGLHRYGLRKIETRIRYHKGV